MNIGCYNEGVCFNFERNDILDTHGLAVWLVDVSSTKQVQGRKTDVKDCRWIQQLHSYGLLNRCFIASELVQ